MTNFITITTPSNRLLRIRLARGFFSRLRGLLFTRRLYPHHGLLLVPCNSVHTCGMAYAIDVVFMDAKGVIVKVDAHVQPWHMMSLKQAHQILELAAGQAAVLGFELGLHLNVGEANFKPPHKGTLSC